VSEGLVVSRELTQLRERIAAARSGGRSVGFVPTMGALHAGHESLVERARADCDVVVASIFVNPRQFAPGEDLDAYPRTYDADTASLSRLGCDHLWYPSVHEMYPDGHGTRVEMDGLTDVLCGASRPTHFGGVLTVVCKLLNQVQPDAAFFGQKDYQQALVIRRMVADLDMPVRIETCPIVREPDGLAMSSRNRRLDLEQRSQAVSLSRALNAMQSAFSSGERRPDELVSRGGAALSDAPQVRLDYLEIRDPHTLALRQEVAEVGDLVAIAAFLGEVRLIDNLLLAAR